MKEVRLKQEEPQFSRSWSVKASPTSVEEEGIEASPCDEEGPHEIGGNCTYLCLWRGESSEPVQEKPIDYGELNQYIAKAMVPGIVDNVFRANPLYTMLRGQAVNIQVTQPRYHSTITDLRDPELGWYMMNTSFFKAP